MSNNTSFSIDIDECASNPCSTNGVCVDLVGSYSCDCVAGFAGPVCNSGKS